MRLNLGCFNKKIYGFTNVDCREEVKPDAVDDIVTLGKFKENTADLILAVHVLEHVKRDDALKALRRWFEVLKPGGTLRVAVPDIAEACRHFVYYGDLGAIYTMFWGSQKHAYDTHLTGWDEKTLVSDLTAAGFVGVRQYNPWTTEHYYIDDYSKSYYPTCNVEFKNGGAKPLNRSMSLNLECTKP